MTKKAKEASYGERVKLPFKRIAADYLPAVKGIFDEDDKRVAMLKRLVSKLDVVDRNIIIEYAELGSTAKLAQVLHVSPRTAAYEVRRIKDALLDEYRRIANT